MSTRSRHDQASEAGSDHGLTPLLRSAEALGATTCEPRGVNVTRMRPSPYQDAEPTRPLRVLLTTDWWEPVVNGVVA